MRRGSTYARGAKIDACALDIIELAGAHRSVIESFAKIEAVANSAAIVYGEHDVAAAREGIDSARKALL